MYNKRENIGQMRHRVQFEKAVYTANDFGERSKSYELQSAVWAHIEYKTSTSGESVEAQRIVSQLYAIVRCRYDRDVTADWRLRHKEARFNIVSVLPDAKRQYMELECIMDEPRDVS